MTVFAKDVTVREVLTEIASVMEILYSLDGKTLVVNNLTSVHVDPSEPA
jgi:hypothetical protein